MTEVQLLRGSVESLQRQRDEWVAKHKECTQLLGEALQDSADMAVERNAYAKWADDMAAAHKVERDALKDAARLALDALVDLKGIRMNEVEHLSVLRATNALKAVL